MDRAERAEELDFELEQLILAALAAQDQLREGCTLTDSELNEWGHLLYGFNSSFVYMHMTMSTHHRSKGFH